MHIDSISPTMKINIFPLNYSGVRRIGIKPLSFDKAFPAMMKQIPGSRWTPEEGCWHIPYEKNAYAVLKRIFGEGQIRVKPGLSPEPAKQQSLKPPLPPNPSDTKQKSAAWNRR